MGHGSKISCKPEGKDLVHTRRVWLRLGAQKPTHRGKAEHRADMGRWVDMVGQHVGLDWKRQGHPLKVKVGMELVEV